MSWFTALTYESSKEEEVKEVTKEEHEINVAHSWMEVRGFWHQQRRKHMDCCSRYFLYMVLLSLSNHSFTVLWLSPAFVTDLFSGFGFVEMGQLIMGGSAVVGD